MSSLSFHRIALVPIIFGLKNTHAVLAKGAKHAEEQNVDLNEYATATLHPDMYNLIKQVQRLTDAAKFMAERANPDVPRFSNPDTETTYPQLLERVKRTTEYLESVDPKLFEGREDVPLEMNFGPIKVEYTVAEYITQFGHPNFWFHATTAYDILRHKGVPVGKMDYMNGAGLKEIKTAPKEDA